MMQGKGYDAKYVAEVPALSAKGLLTGTATRLPEGPVVIQNGNITVKAKTTIFDSGTVIEKGANLKVLSK